MTLWHSIMNNKDRMHMETVLLDLIWWWSLFFPSLCELVLPFHSMSYYSWQAIAGGWGMSNSKNDDWTSLRLLKATASTVWAIQETRSWETRYIFSPQTSSHFRWLLSCWQLHQFPAGMLTGLPYLRWSWSHIAFNAWWCKWFWAGCVNNPVFAYLKKKAKARLQYF